MERKQSNPKSARRGAGWIVKIISTIENCLLVLAGISLILILSSIIYGVISRSFFNIPVLWVNDLAGYLALYLVFLSAPWVLRNNGHVQVDIITANLEGVKLKVNTFIIAVVSGISCALFCWFSFKAMLTYYQNETVIMESVLWPKFILVSPIAIGSLFLFLRFCLILPQLFTKESVNHQEENEHPIT